MPDFVVSADASGAVREAVAPDQGDTYCSFFVRALFDYTPKERNMLSFRRGAVIEVLTQMDNGWWDGMLNERTRGWFPSNYVKLISDAEAEMSLAQLRAAELTRPAADGATAAAGTAAIDSLSAFERLAIVSSPPNSLEQDTLAEVSEDSSSRSSARSSSSLLEALLDAAAREVVHLITVTASEGPQPFSDAISSPQASERVERFVHSTSNVVLAVRRLLAASRVSDMVRTACEELGERERTSLMCLRLLSKDATSLLSLLVLLMRELTKKLYWSPAQSATLSEARAEYACEQRGVSERAVKLIETLVQFTTEIRHSGLRLSPPADAGPSALRHVGGQPNVEQVEPTGSNSVGLDDAVFSDLSTPPYACLSYPGRPLDRATVMSEIEPVYVHFRFALDRVFQALRLHSYAVAANKSSADWTTAVRTALVYTSRLLTLVERVDLAPPGGRQDTLYTVYLSAAAARSRVRESAHALLTGACNALQQKELPATGVDQALWTRTSSLELSSQRLIQLLYRCIGCERTGSPAPFERVASARGTAAEPLDRDQHSVENERVAPVDEPVDAPSNTEQPSGNAAPDAQLYEAPAGSFTSLRQKSEDRASRQSSAVASLSTDGLAAFGVNGTPVPKPSDDEAALVLENDTVKGGSLPALVAYLTKHDVYSPGFTMAFLATFKTFTTTEEFLRLVIRRFQIAPPADLDEPQLSLWRTSVQRPVRLRSFNVIKTWLEAYYCTEDADVLPLVRHFIEADLGACGCHGQQQVLQRTLSRVASGLEGPERQFSMLNSPPPPILPRHLNRIALEEIDPVEWARQLTLRESYLFRQIKPHHCLRRASGRKRGSQELPSISEATAFHNQVTNWVQESVLRSRDTKQRASILKRFIQIAEHCLQLQNYSTLWAITAALNCAAIYRLRRTWGLLSQRVLRVFDNLTQVTDPGRNFATYRKILREVNPPCVPFFGMYTKDLTFIQDGNPDYLPNSTLINFHKRQLLADVLREITVFQSARYNFFDVPAISVFLETLRSAPTDDMEFFERSLELEPRAVEKNEVDQLTDQLRQNGFL